jgi:tRNA (guanine26-N2/guanine27-N2)-dimethyltransferase
MITEEFVETIEGKTRLLVPATSLIKVPAKAPAFFNPSARLNRDISVLAYRTFVSDIKRNDEKTFADSLSGIGARALRIAVEVPEIEEIYMNDINIIGINIAKKAARLNLVVEKCNFSAKEVCKFLTEHATKNGKRFTVVDLDPFGSPSPYVDCVLRAVLNGGLLSLTATDTAVLSGVYPEVCFCRYYGRPLKNYYANEIAIRLIISLTALTASRLRLAVRPLFVHANLHYFRVYVRILVSSNQANRVYDNIGYLRHCFRCGNRNVIREYDKSEACELCGGHFNVGGQLWIAQLFDKGFIKKMASCELNSSDISNNKNNDHIRKMLSTCIDEIDDIPHYFRLDEIASKLKTNPCSLQKVIEKLHRIGYKVSKTSLNPRAFKTNARVDQILEALR